MRVMSRCRFGWLICRLVNCMLETTGCPRFGFTWYFCSLKSEINSCEEALECAALTQHKRRDIISALVRASRQRSQRVLANYSFDRPTVWPLGRSEIAIEFWWRRNLQPSTLASSSSSVLKYLCERNDQNEPMNNEQNEGSE